MSSSSIEEFLLDWRAAVPKGWIPGDSGGGLARFLQWAVSAGEIEKLADALKRQGDEAIEEWLSEIAAGQKDVDLLDRPYLNGIPGGAMQRCLVIAWRVGLFAKHFS